MTHLTEVLASDSALGRLAHDQHADGDAAQRPRQPHVNLQPSGRLAANALLHFVALIRPNRIKLQNQSIQITNSNAARLRTTYTYTRSTH